MPRRLPPSSDDASAEARNARRAHKNRRERRQSKPGGEPANRVTLNRVVHLSREIVGEQARHQKVAKLDWGFHDLLKDAQITPANWQRVSDGGATTVQTAPTGSAGQYSVQTVHNMFDALQQHFGTFPLFEDVPTFVLEAEKASEAHLDATPRPARKAAG